MHLVALSGAATSLKDGGTCEAGVDGHPQEQITPGQSTVCTAHAPHSTRCPAFRKRGAPADLRNVRLRIHGSCSRPPPAQPQPHTLREQGEQVEPSATRKIQTQRRGSAPARRAEAGDTTLARTMEVLLRELVMVSIASKRAALARPRHGLALTLSRNPW
jgi:hypothetical protein